MVFFYVCLKVIIKFGCMLFLFLVLFVLNVVDDYVIKKEERFWG